MQPYWCQVSGLPDFHPLKLGIGVTAHDEGDARRIVRDKFGDVELSKLTLVADVSELDPGHVRPNMASIFIRGIWYPLGHQDVGKPEVR